MNACVICSTWKLKDLCYAPSIPNFDMHYIDQVILQACIYARIRARADAHARARTAWMVRARARVYAPSPGPIRPLVKASMRARDTCTTCPRNKLSIAVVSEISRTSKFSSAIKHSLLILFYAITVISTFVAADVICFCKNCSWLWRLALTLTSF